MRTIIICSVLCLVGVLRAAKISDDENETIIVPKTIYHKSLIKYRAKYDIVEILVPINRLNFGSSSDSSSREDLSNVNTIFFAVADIKDGERVDHGIYIYKDGNVKQILMNGRTAAAAMGDNKLVFFGASDGLYIYDLDSNTAVKYGPISDGIISIATEGNGETIYIVTDDHKLYKVTDNGETKTLVDDVEDALQIVLDDANNIYYYNSNKEVFIRTIEGVIQVTGLPPNTKSVTLIRPPFIMTGSILLMYDNSLYSVYINGTSDAANLEFAPDAIPTAYGPEGIFLQYYAFNKRLYEYDFFTLTSEDIFKNIKFKTEVIQSTATKTKHRLTSKKV